MDWSTGDYTQTYADTIYVPEQEYGEGVYLLDETGQESDPYLRVPIRPYEMVIRQSCPDKGKVTRRPGSEVPRREGYYTGGNIISERGSGNDRRVFDVAWDERPQHYNPNSGPGWAHLVPDPRARPYGGGPAPSLAFPMTTNSEATVYPSHNPFPSATSKECFSHVERQQAPYFGGGASPCCTPATSDARQDLYFHLIKIILLVVIVVLLAMTLMASTRLAHDLEKTVKEAVRALGAVAVK
jgi:hypothetical protein